MRRMSTTRCRFLATQITSPSGCLAPVQPRTVLDMTTTSQSLRSSRRHGRLGLPVIALVGLASLAAPRVVLHDLGVIAEGSLVNALLVFGPPVIWILVAVCARVPNPFLTVLTIGAIYGVFLTVGHQIFWTTVWANDPPRLGGNLAGQLAPAVESVILRIFAVFSSLFTGALVGAISGLVAWILSRGRRYAASDLS
jgi:hypothetical protein